MKAGLLLCLIPLVVAYPLLNRDAETERSFRDLVQSRPSNIEKVFEVIHPPNSSLEQVTLEQREAKYLQLLGGTSYTEGYELGYLHKLYMEILKQRLPRGGVTKRPNSSEKLVTLDPKRIAEGLKR